MTEQNLSSLFDSLREIAPKLNKATDEANRVIRVVEEFLSSLSLGIPGSVEIESVSLVDEDDREVEKELHLRYRKHGNAFRLIIERVNWHAETGDGPPREEILGATPLAEASRHEKLLAVAQIPNLLRAIVAEASRVQTAAENAIEAVDAIVFAMNPSAKSETLAEASVFIPDGVIKPTFRTKN